MSNYWNSFSDGQLILGVLRWGYILTIAVLFVLLLFSKHSFLKSWLRITNGIVGFYMLLMVILYADALINGEPVSRHVDRGPLSGVAYWLYQLLFSLLFAILFCFRSARQLPFLSVCCAIFLLSDAWIVWFITLHRDYLPSGWGFREIHPWSYVIDFLLFQVLVLTCRLLIIIERRFKIQTDETYTNTTGPD
ncbi:MAG TPA: hypothetical protein VD996_03035 [Chitinophagaceae bacterium]|nr:hypothetical protein [Chitinophagaceae bacterium]